MYEMIPHIPTTQVLVLGWRGPGDCSSCKRDDNRGVQVRQDMHESHWHAKHTPGTTVHI